MQQALRPVLYTQRNKAKHHMEAMEAGWPEAERYDLANGRLAKDKPGMRAVHIIGGLQFGALERLREIRAANLDYVFYDRAYFGGGPQSDRLRITARAYQKHLLDLDAPAGRAARIGVELQPWREGGTHIMVVPPGEAIRALFGLGNWEAETMARLKRATERQAWISRKGAEQPPLAERLRDCWAVVTWSSNVAVEAICAGVPAFVSSWSAAAPVAGNLAELEARIEAPRRPEREAWAESLAWGQFNLEEIRSGFARSVVMETFA